MKILCVNAGSSSLKYQLVEMPEEKVIISGYIEKIGQPDCFWNTKINGQKIKGEKPLKNHTEAVEVLLDELIKHGAVSDISEIEGVGHRVLHGGEKYSDSTLIDEDVIKDIEDLTPLGKLHHPGNLAGIRSMMTLLPGVPNVAVFDTAFHQTMPKENFLYPVPYEWYEKYGVRKYGFHGTSHKYLTTKYMEETGNEKPNLITVHVGSGASVACIKDGKCFDTTMGLSPLDGLMMGTRCGNIDATVVNYVCEQSGMTSQEVDDALNKKSGLLGICGFNDNRDVEEAIKNGDEKAKLALDMYVDRIAKVIAEYYVKLEGKVDSIIMTAGVLENGIDTRKAIIDKLACLGIKIDENVNSQIAGFKDQNEGVISTDDSTVEVRVMPTNEEIMIVKDTFNIVEDIKKNEINGSKSL